jgi:hypothetical protein
LDRARAAEPGILEMALTGQAVLDVPMVS